MRKIKMTAQEFENRQEATKAVEAELAAQKLDAGKWIMVTRTIHPSPNFPPKASIHWSTPWPQGDLDTLVRQRLTESLFGFDPDRLTARKINFNGGEVRIYEHEYSLVSTENMAMYIIGFADDKPTHTLRPSSAAEQAIQVGVMDGEQRPIYDAALVDGATESQAFRVALGLDVLDAVEFPPLGWYELTRQDCIDAFGDQ